MIRPMRDLLRCAAARQPAQGLTEYGVILVGVAMAVAVAVYALGPQLTSFYTTVRSSIPAQ